MQHTDLEGMRRLHCSITRYMPLALGPLQSQFALAEGISWPQTWAHVQVTLRGQLYVVRATVDGVVWLLAPLAVR